MVNGRPTDNEEEGKCSEKKIQRTRGEEAQREVRSNQYIKAKKKYQTISYYD